MQINVTTRHGSLSDANRDKIVSKAEKLTRIFDRLTAIELIVDMKEGQKPRVDVKVNAEHKHDFQSHDTSDKVIAAAESAIHKMEQQLRRYKDKVQNRGRNPEARRVDAVADPGDDSEE